MAVERGVVKYRKNGTLIYTSTVSPTYPLLVDTSLYTNGSTISDVVLSGNWGGSSGSSSASINWLVSDHLGTPRMIIDKSGALANVKRHDYLPFGEELFPGTGGRTTVQGYAGDNLRQKLAGTERDNETGLDFMQARYYSSTHGRFSSTDPIVFAPERATDPQQINLYAYGRNNPLRFADPEGEKIIEPSGLSKEHQDEYNRNKAAFLATTAGAALWKKYEEDTSFTLTIAVGSSGTLRPSNDESAITGDPVFDGKGNLTGATIVLGSNIESGAPSDGNSYPILSSLGEAGKLARAVGKIAHEFGHVEDFRGRGARFYQEHQLAKERQQLFDQLSGREYRTNKRVSEITAQLGPNLSRDRDVRAERTVIPVLRQHFGKRMPRAVKTAVKNYEKSYGKVP